MLLLLRKERQNEEARHDDEARQVEGRFDDRRVVGTSLQDQSKRVPLSQSAVRAADVITVEMLDRAISEDIGQLESPSPCQAAALIVARVIESARSKVLREDRLPPAATWTEKAQREARLLVEDVVSSALIYVGRGGDVDPAGGPPAAVCRIPARWTVDDEQDGSLLSAELPQQPSCVRQDSLETPSLTDQVSIIMQPCQQQQCPVMSPEEARRALNAAKNAQRSLAQKTSKIDAPSLSVQWRNTLPYDQLDSGADRPAAFEARTSNTATPSVASNPKARQSNLEPVTDAKKAPPSAVQQERPTRADHHVQHDVQRPASRQAGMVSDHGRLSALLAGPSAKADGGDAGAAVSGRPSWRQVFDENPPARFAPSGTNADSHLSFRDEATTPGRPSWREATGSRPNVHDHPSALSENDRSRFSTFHDEATTPSRPSWREATGSRPNVHDHPSALSENDRSRFSTFHDEATTPSRPSWREATGSRPNVHDHPSALSENDRSRFSTFHDEATTPSRPSWREVFGNRPNSVHENPPAGSNVKVENERSRLSAYTDEATPSRPSWRHTLHDVQ